MGRPVREVVRLLLLMYSAFILEDEPLARDHLRSLAAEIPWMEVVGEAGDSSALALIESLRPDVLFVDIALPGASGLDVLQQLSFNPAVVFTTAYAQHAVRAFDLHAIDYLLKPFDRARFIETCKRLEAQLAAGESAEDATEVRRLLQESLASERWERLFVRNGARILPLRVDGIQRLAAEGDSVRVFGDWGNHLVSAPLATLEARLDPATFVRVHRSHIVNLDYVVAFEQFDSSRLQVRMADSTVVVASRRRSSELRQLAQLRGEDSQLQP
jgi:two-component system, LytTR family, response regulator